MACTNEPKEVLDSLCVEYSAFVLERDYRFLFFYFSENSLLKYVFKIPTNYYSSNSKLTKQTQKNDYIIIMHRPFINKKPKGLYLHHEI